MFISYTVYGILLQQPKHTDNYTPIRMSEIFIKTHHKQILEREWGNWNSLTKLVGMLNGTITLKNSLAGFLNIKHSLTIWSSHFIPRYLPKRDKSICSYKDLFMNVYSIFICNSPKLEITKCPSKGEWDKQIVYLHNGIPSINKKK